MVSFIQLLSAVLASQPVALPERPQAASATVWVAQEGGEVRVPPVGPKRFMSRDAVKSAIRRHPVGGPRGPNDEGSPDNPDQNAAPTPPPTATPAPVPPPMTPPPRPSPVPPPSGGATSAGQPSGEKAESEIDYAARAKKGKFSFEFSKAEIADVVKAISNLTQYNFIIPEKIKGQRITILSPGKISAWEAWRVFLVALEVNGITVVRAGKFYKLVESKDGIKSPIPTCIGDNDSDCPKFDDQMVTLLLPMKYVDANQVNPVVKSLISKEGEVTVFQPSNSLIISEYAPNLTRVRRIIEALDVPGFEDELQIVQVKYAVATELADKLTQIFDVKAGGAAAANKPGGVPPPRTRPPPTKPEAGVPSPEGAAAGQTPGEESSEVSISKIVPDDRTNQLIIKANRRSFDSIKKLIGRLDVPTGEGESGRVHVYYLENADAEELSSTLSSLAQGQPNSTGKKGSKGGTPPGPGSQPTQRGGESASLFEGEVKITADKSTNSLLIMSSGRDFTSLKKIIEKLDTPRRQVYVEVAILEVQVSDDSNLSLNWHAPMRFSEADLGQKLGGSGTLGFIQSAQSGSTSPTLGALASPQALLGAVGGSVVGVIGKGTTFKVGDSNVSIPTFGIILKALQSSTLAQVLSTPHMLTTDNEEASIEVGQKIPFRSGTALPSLGGLGATGLAGSALGSTGLTGAGATSALSALGGYGNLFSSVQRIDVSLKLSLTPQINERDKVRLKIDQQIEDFAGMDEITQTPKTSTRNIKTVVVVDDQETVVLGGLMKDNTSESESKIPILGDLPLIGWLFKQQSKTVQKVNLLLVLTPYIIRDSSDFQRIFARKMKEYEEFAAEFYGSRPEYRAHIDYARKSGPFARLAVALKREKSKVENGGKGDEEGLIIKPDKRKGDEGGEAAPEETTPTDAIIVPPATEPGPTAPASPAEPTPPPDGGGA